MWPAFLARPRALRASGVAEPKVIARSFKTSPKDIIMRNINLRYVDEAHDENGLLTRFDITMPDNFNFAYDVAGRHRDQRSRAHRHGLVQSGRRSMSSPSPT